MKCPKCKSDIEMRETCCHFICRHCGYGVAKIKRKQEGC